MPTKSRITFLLPGDNLSGGVRVTAQMGNLLRERGHDVRMALPARWRQLWLNPSLARSPAGAATGWLRGFNGPIVSYHDINRLDFIPGEVVIGVGTYMIADLRKIADPDVVKVRYNHGFPAQMTAAQLAAWSLPLPTITVSSTLVPQLERLTGRRVDAVIPNGLDPQQYFPVPGVPRDAIGTIYAVHPNKAPQDILGLLRRSADRWPATPLVVFGTEPRPKGMPPGQYEQSPSVELARKLYSRSLVWLLASHSEGLPGPVLEAMACGAVVISTNNEGSLAVIRDGENGLLVRKGDLQGFLSRIHRVRTDEALRTRLVGGGFATVARFSWAAAVEKMENFLHTLPAPALAERA